MKEGGEISIAPASAGPTRAHPRGLGASGPLDGGWRPPGASPSVLGPDRPGEAARSTRVVLVGDRPAPLDKLCLVFVGGGGGEEVLVLANDIAFVVVYGAAGADVARVSRGPDKGAADEAGGLSRGGLCLGLYYIAAAVAVGPTLLPVGAAVLCAEADMGGGGQRGGVVGEFAADLTVPAPTGVTLAALGAVTLAALGAIT